MLEIVAYHLFQQFYSEAGRADSFWSPAFPMRSPHMLFGIMVFILLAGYHDLKHPPCSMQQVGRHFLIGAVATAFAELVPIVNRVTAKEQTFFTHFDVSWLIIYMVLYRLLAGLVVVCVGTKRSMASRWTLGTLALGLRLVSTGPMLRRPGSWVLFGHVDLLRLGEHWYCYALLPLLLPRGFLEGEWCLLPRIHQVIGQRVATGALFAGCLAVHKSLTTRWLSVSWQYRNLPVASSSLVLVSGHMLFILVCTCLSQLACVVSLSSLLPSQASVLSRLGDSCLVCLVVHSMLLPHITANIEMTKSLGDLVAPFGSIAILIMLYTTAFTLQTATSAQLSWVTLPAVPRWIRALSIRPPSWPLFLSSWCFLALLYIRSRLVVTNQVWLHPMITEAGFGRRDLAVQLDARHQFAVPIIGNEARWCQRVSISFGPMLAHSPLQCALLTASHHSCGTRFMFTHPLRTKQLGCQCCASGDFGREGGQQNHGRHPQNNEWSTWDMDREVPFGSLSPSSAMRVADHMGMQFHLARTASICPSSHDISRGDGSIGLMGANATERPQDTVASPLQCAMLVFAAGHRPNRQHNRCGELFLWSGALRGCRCCLPDASIGHAQRHVRTGKGACFR